MSTDTHLIEDFQGDQKQINSAFNISDIQSALTDSTVYRYQFVGYMCYFDAKKYKQHNSSCSILQQTNHFRIKILPFV